MPVLRSGHRGVSVPIRSSEEGRRTIQSEDWFVTIDLKDAYFHVSIHPHHRKFLRFAFGGKAYQYWVLPFGLGLSPRIFTKCVDAALAPLRLQGIRVLNYLDDWLILAQSEQLAVRHRDVILSHIKRLGLWLNAKKSVLLPAQRTTFLGVLWDSTIMQARLSPARISAILTAVKGVKLSQSLTVKQFQRLLGLMAAASNVITFGLLYMRPLQWLRIKGFSLRGNPFCTIKVMRRCLRALVKWKKPWFLAQGPVLGASCRRVTLSTDASLTGWGAVMSGRSAKGLLQDHQRSWRINRLEMMAVFRALKYFLPDLRGHHVLVLPDNTLMVSNIRADILLRQGLRPGEWRLHPKVVELLWENFDETSVLAQAHDCYYLGIPNGFDHERLLKSARVCDMNGRKHICFRDKVAENIYGMFHTRYTLHRQALQHKIGYIIDVKFYSCSQMYVYLFRYIRIRDAFVQANGPLKISNAINNMLEYTELTDHIFDQILNKPMECIDSARSILGDVLDRKLPKFVGEARLKEDELKHMHGDSSRAQPVKAFKTKVYQVLEMGFGEVGNEPIENVHFYSKNEPNKAFKMEKYQVSSLKPRKFHEWLVRVYYDPKGQENLEVQQEAERKAAKCFHAWCENNKNNFIDFGPHSGK
ncbi:hypothetical protein PO909_016345 [Leuciscus waleckii]